MSIYYNIKIKGRLDPSWSDWFADLKISYPEEQVTAISGYLPDQAALHGVLKRIRDLNLDLISVSSDTTQCLNKPEIESKPQKEERKNEKLHK